MRNTFMFGASCYFLDNMYIYAQPQPKSSVRHKTTKPPLRWLFWDVINAERVG